MTTEIMTPGWLSDLPETVNGPFVDEDSQIAKDLAEKLKADFTSGDTQFTSICVYIDSESGKVSIYSRYEDNSRLRETGSEDTMQDIVQFAVDWKGVKPLEENHTTNQIKRGLLLAKEMGLSLMIESWKEDITALVQGGKVVCLSKKM